MASGSGGSLPTFVARRLLITIPLLLLISLGVFSLVLLLPGDPAVYLAGGAKASASEIAKVRHHLHLDEGFFAQYWHWLTAALHGDLGNSLFQNQSIAGAISGIRQGTASDRLVTVGSSLGVAVPDFWLAMLLVVLFAVDLHWLPALGFVPFAQSPYEWFLHLLLPWIALGLGGAATIARQVRGALIDTMD